MSQKPWHPTEDPPAPFDSIPQLPLIWAVWALIAYPFFVLFLMYMVDTFICLIAWSYFSSITSVTLSTWFISIISSIAILFIHGFLVWSCIWNYRYWRHAVDEHNQRIAAMRPSPPSP